MRTLTTLLVTAAILCLMTPMIQAQTDTTGQITGVVTDPSGAVVAGANVALTSDAGVRRETQSGSNGRYAFPLLDPGKYRLEVSVSGFALTKLEGITVQITESTVMDGALKVGGTATTVSVTGEAPLVQTESSARGTVIGETQVRDLPLPTRNFQQLLALTTGTSGPIENSSELGRGDVPYNTSTGSVRFRTASSSMASMQTRSARGRCQISPSLPSGHLSRRVRFCQDSAELMERVRNCDSAIRYSVLDLRSGFCVPSNHSRSRAWQNLGIRDQEWQCGGSFERLF
jgi:hypothetical protein